MGTVISLIVFVVLLAVSILLLWVIQRYSTTKKEEVDYRIVHFTLRLALAFGIGAVAIGVLIVIAILGLQFWESS